MDVVRVKVVSWMWWEELSVCDGGESNVDVVLGIYWVEGQMCSTCTKNF